MQKCINFVNNILGHDHSGHDTQHVIAVYNIAMKIAANEEGCDLEAIKYAAMLHDVDDHKISPKTSINKNNAREFLQSINLSKENIDYIIYVIDHVSWSKNKGIEIPDINVKIIQDADRLTAIGATGIARAFMFTGAMGNTMDEGIQHFYDKLLLIEAQLNTDTAKVMARSRQKAMLDFLSAFDKERRETMGL